MRRMTILTAGIIAALFSACSHVSPRYGVSGNNIEALRTSLAATDTKVAVGSFTTFEPGLSSITCRAVGPVSPSDGLTYEKYIEQAIISELKIAGAFAADSPARLDARLDYVTFSSNIGAGKWQIDMTFQGPGIAPFTLNTVYLFSTNFVGDVACTQVANALPAAVQDLIGKLIAHPSFNQLVARRQ